MKRVTVWLAENAPPLMINLSKAEVGKALLASEGEAAMACKFIRTRSPLEEQEHHLLEIQDSNPYLEPYLVGIRFAKSWEQIWIKPKTASISSSQKSLDWLVLIFKRHAQQLTEHVSIREQFYKAVLRGENSLADQFLNQHHQRFGPTFWSLNWTLLTLDESSGAQEKFDFAKRFRTADFDNSLIPYFVDLFCFSTDATLSDASYKQIVNNHLPEKGGIRTLLELLFLDDCISHWELADVLDLLDFIPIVDRYELFLKIVGVAFAHDHKDSVRISKAAWSVYNLTSDSALLYAYEAFTPETKLSNIQQSEQLIQAWDYYVKGDYQSCLEAARIIGNENPELLQAHELVIKSHLYLKQRLPPGGSAPVSSVSRHLQNIYSKNEKSDDSIGYLQIFARRFRIPPLSNTLRALCANQSAGLADARVFRCSSFTAGIHSPRNFDYGIKHHTNHGYLSRCKEAFPWSLSVDFFETLAQGRFLLDDGRFLEIPKVRKLFFSGISAFRQGQLDPALALLKGFLRLQKDDASNPLSPFAIEEARKSLVEINRIKGDVLSMQQEVVNTLLERPSAVRRLPMQLIFDAACAQKQLAGAQIEFPLIAHLTCDNPHDIYLALNYFLSRTGVSRPSELQRLNVSSTKKLSLLFLRVCTTEVIDSLDSLDSLSKVETERINILRWVTRNGSNLAPIAETEVLRLVQNAQLRDALEKIDGGRVVVNVAALREAERDRFKDIYLRFLSLRDVASSKATEQWTDIINTISNKISNSDSNSPHVIVIESGAISLERDAHIKAFASAFMAIRDAFVYSAHFGVEASLSGRIRHGIVIQHIRKPFVERKLVVLEDSPERQEIEKFWVERLGCSQSQIAEILKVLFALTAEVNKIAEEVKTVWLHSRTETKHPHGLFNYAFFTAEMGEMLESKFSDVHDSEMFLDRVFDVLLERTRGSLKTTRERIDDELRQRLGKAVDNAVGKLSDIYCAQQLLTIKNDLLACRQVIERLCDQMMNWFQEADATLMGDAGIDLVARTAIGMVEQLNPEVIDRFQFEVGEIKRIKGKYFSSLVHIIFFMLDNARAHSDVEKKDFKVLLKLQSANNIIEVAVSSWMKSAQTGEKSIQRINSKKQELAKGIDPNTVTKEGGSGLAKIFAEVIYGFKKLPPIIACSLDQNNKLTVSLKFSIQEMMI